MHLEGDVLDLYAWVTCEHEIILWDDLVRVFQESYRLPDFQNPVEYLCYMKQVGTMAKYCIELARRAARVTNRPKNAFCGAFTVGLKDELKSDVRCSRPLFWLSNLS